MLGGIILLLVVLVAGVFHSVNTQEPKCKMAPVFGAVGNTPFYRPSNQSLFCKNLNSTCCSAEDFKTMQTVWEGNTTDSVKNTRTKDMKQMVKFLEYLDTADKGMEKMAELIKKNSKVTGHPACVTPAFLQRDVASLDLIQTLMTTYKSSARKCWNYTKNLMNGIMCAACDADAQNFIDASNRNIYISNDECSLFVDSCAEHVKSVNALYFYYGIMYRLTFCDGNGTFLLKQVPEFSNFPESAIKVINGCLFSKNKDDCATVCKKNLGFTTMVNYEYYAKPQLDKGKKAIEEYLKLYGDMNFSNNSNSTNKTDNKTTPVVKRVLNQQAVQELDRYNVIVMKNGVRFSQYTKDNLDGFTDISEAEVFFGAIHTVSLLAISMLLLLLN